ncbi:hypothetical protein [Priestia endophytica]|jgi:hypothetical protein|uniref:hypothetical protein n=1 Tax=Priestia endophytica TaxID=135735 RepID=UPI000FB8CAD2|nr:hypothetical protein [Priestia endophytica]MED4071886.1 hypothetical protein [Priestia endophytica]RPK06264.1 hypothetical protein FH5_05433 [Priestia endophytica]
MKNLISMKMASYIILAINTLALLMHGLILLNILPYDFVWGGRLKKQEDVILFEMVSILIQVVFISIVAVKAGYILKGKFKRTSNIGIWVIFGMMILNSLGNLASHSFLETVVMTPITILLALLVFRLAIEK